MRRGRVFILLALILLLGAVAAYLVLNSLGGGDGGQPSAEATPPVVRDAEIVIAAQDIARGAVIPEDGVILSPYPADYVVETMMTDLQLVAGKRARMEIARGVPITQNMITETAGDLLGAGSDAAIAIPPGFTAISIPMNRFSGVAYALRSGDNVDVLVSLLILDFDPDFQTPLPNVTSLVISPDGELQVAIAGDNITLEPGTITVEDEEPLPLGKIFTDEESGLQFYIRQPDDQWPRLVTQRLIKNATVLNVGEFQLEEEAAEAVATEPQEGVGAPPPQGQQQIQEPTVQRPTIISLIVSPQDALALNWAVRAGADLMLTLRSPDDAAGDADTDSVTLEYLIENYEITIPSRPAYGTLPRLVAPDLTFSEGEAVQAEEQGPQ